MTLPVATPDCATTAFTAARFGMRSQTRYRGHKHANWHLMFVHSGEFEEAGAQHGFHVNAGQVRLSPANLSHDLKIGERAVDCINFHIHDAALCRMLEARSGRQHRVFDVTAAQRLPDATDFASAMDRDRELSALLACLVNGLEPGMVPAWLEDANQLLTGSDLSVADIAAKCRVSREHLARRYFGYFGQSPIAARKHARARQAVLSIERDDQPLVDIALDSGFYDQGHMSNIIREILGVTPRNVRHGQQ